jgi:hypothetical protein
MAVAYNPSIVTDGLVFQVDAANIKSYSGSGTNVTNICNSNYTGVLNNGVGFSSNNNGVFTFDGSNDYISFVPNDIFNIGTGDFTLLAWHKTSYKSNYSTIMSLDDGNGTGYLLYTSINSGVMRNWVAGVPKNGNIDICTGVWNLIGLTRTSGLCTQYVNGVVDTTFTASGVLQISGRTLSIGQNTNSYYYNGNISTVQIYNRALSQQEILQNYNATKGRYL